MSSVSKAEYGLGQSRHHRNNPMKPAINKYLAAIAAKGGSVKSQAKAEAARLNGLKGGRPKTRKKRWQRKVKK